MLLKLIDLMNKNQTNLAEKPITLEYLIKSHNHEIWRKCICGNEEDLRMTFVCSECRTKIFIPSKNYER